MATETLNINGLSEGWTGATFSNAGDVTDIDEAVASADGDHYGPGAASDPATFDLSASTIGDDDTVTNVSITVRLQKGGTAGSEQAQVILVVGGAEQGSAVTTSDLTTSFADYGPLNDTGWNSDWSASQIAGMQIRVTPVQTGMPGTNAVDIDCADVVITYTPSIPSQNLDNITGFANAQAFGTHTINAGVTELDLDGGGIASTTAFGTDYTLNAGVVFLDLDTAGIASTTAFGDPGIAPQFLVTDITFYGSGASNIGGAIAAALTSGTLNNLWDDVSSGDAAGGDTEYRCVYIRNTHPSQTITNVFANINTDPSESDIAIGLGTAGLNGTETEVADEDTAPGGVSFGAGDVSIGNLSGTDHYGLWIRRTVTAGAGEANPDTNILILRFDDPNP